ncbi:MAG TPA: hypothetical protein V6D23_01150 [Candidatus Obscuribacterales bacterium]
MKSARLVAALFLAAQLCLPAMAGNESWQQFTSFELGLMFLDPKGLTESADDNLDNLFSASSSIMSGMPAGSQAAAQPLADGIGKVKGQVLGAARGQSSALQPYLQPYQVLGKSPLRYEQISLPGKVDLRRLVEQSNDLLKRTYRVTSTVQVSEQLLPQLKADLAKLEPNNAMQKASLGIVAVSLANLNLSASQAAAKIAPELQEMQQKVERQLKSTQSAVSSNPMNAMSMGEDIQVLTSLTSTLGHASTELLGASKKLPAIAGNLQGIITQLT